jgi:putative ABC transport system ATP-binding protein
VSEDPAIAPAPAAAQTAALRVQHLSYAVPTEDGSKRTILDDVTFDVPAGRIFTVLGPSGSGKSTLLRAIDRLVEADAGRILLDGVPTTELHVQELRRRVGMVFQTAALFDGTVLDNVLYGPRLRHEEVAEHEAAHDLLQRVGLHDDFASRPVDGLSGGEAQRVSLARTLANRPAVVLLDEPTASLDPTAGRQVEELLLHLAAEADLTYLFVTHDLHQARRIGDRGLLLVDGRVVEEGPLHELLADPGHETTRLFVDGRLEGTSA